MASIINEYIEKRMSVMDLKKELSRLRSEYNKLTNENYFKCEDYCIYYPERIPEDEEDKKTLLTKEQIRKMIAEFFTKIADNVPECENLTIKWW